MDLKVAKDLTLPPDVVTQTIAILAKRRVGKSYTMRKIAEQLLKAKQQVVIVDPKGDQWGIRSKADGKGPGYPIVILGGEHGDVPLEKNSGEIVAKLVVEEQVSVLLDLSMFRKYEIATFMTDFMENLYRLKAQEKYRTPLMVVVDEADAIAPQKPQKGEERMLGAIEDIVRRGGQRGIGCILVTQRSAVLNKNVLTQAQMLVVLRTIAPQDLAAMQAWIDVHGEPEQRKILMESLPSLPIGDAWFWSPGWPTEVGIFKRTHVLPIETFDSAATPKPGEKKVIPKNLADVNLDTLKKQMAGTIEKMKQDDPKALKKRLRELQTELKRTKTPVALPQIKTVVDEKAVQKAVTFALGAQKKEYEKEIDSWRKLVEHFRKIHLQSAELFAGSKQPEIYKAQVGDVHTYVPFSTRADRDENMYIPQMQVTKGEPITIDTSAITGPEQRVLDGIAWMENIGIEQPAREIVCFLSGYAHVLSKGFTVPCGALRTRGLLTYPAPGKIALTPVGRQLARFPDKPGTSEDLQDIVLDRLDGPKQRVLKPLLETYPNDMSGEELCAAAGYMHPLSKGYTVPRGKLKTFGLIEYPSSGRVRAADILFI